MRELTYTLLELEREYRDRTCDFCSSGYNKNNKAVNQITTRIKVSGKYISDELVCEDCKEKFENDELLKCSRCGRLQTQLDIDMLCRCITREENLEEKELPSLPYESQATFYERQINSLQEEKSHLATEAQSHLDAMEAFEVYNKKHRQEWLDRIKELEAENKRLKESTPQELLDEISKLKERVRQLEEQNSQSTAQIEVKETKRWPWKLRK